MVDLMAKDKKFLQKAIKRPGRVTRYVKREYGDKAFTDKGDIKVHYLDMAENKARKAGDTSLERAIILAKRLKKMPKR